MGSIVLSQFLLEVVTNSKDSLLSVSWLVTSATHDGLFIGSIVSPRFLSLIEKGCQIEDVDALEIHTPEIIQNLGHSNREGCRG
jgi:hypothetical protein